MREMGQPPCASGSPNAARRPAKTRHRPDGHDGHGPAAACRRRRATGPPPQPPPAGPHAAGQPQDREHDVKAPAPVCGYRRGPLDGQRKLPLCLLQRSPGQFGRRGQRGELRVCCGDAGRECGEELARGGGLPAEIEVDPVVRQQACGQAPVARQRQGGQPQPGRPALGPRMQQREGRLRQLHPGRGEQLPGLIESEPEVGRADLGDLAFQPQPVQPQPQIMAGGEHAPQLRRGAHQQQLKLAQRLGRAQLVHIVDHQPAPGPAATPGPSAVARRPPSHPGQAPRSRAAPR